MSTLHVENLKGLSSGGNANKIIVPSGQTLDASNGFITPAGHVIQVVQTANTTAITTNSTSAASTGISVNITPSSTSSKIHVSFSARTYINNAAREHVITILRGSTVIRGGYTIYSTAGAIAAMTYLHVLDSPSTTSQVTYSLTHHVSISDSTGYINPNGAGDGSWNLTAMEIEG